MRRTVLIVHGETLERMALAAAFDTAGYRAIACASTTAARAALGSARVDALLLDGRLPDSQSAGLLTDARSRTGGHALRVLLLTAPSGATTARDLLHGADEEVALPCDPSEIVTRVHGLIGAPRAGTVATILVIAGSRAFRLLAGATLTRVGYRVIEAATGEEGLQLAGTRRPHAVLVDGVLAGIDGPTVIRRIRLDAALRDTPCLLLTSSDEDEEWRALEAGADAFVRKEENLSYLLARVGPLLRSAPSRSEEAGMSHSLTRLKRILLVADATAGVQWLSDVLGGDGYEVMIARSGQEALELFAAHSVNCILLDRLVPGLSAEEMTARIGLCRSSARFR